MIDEANDLYVVLCDVVGSRRIEDRGAFESRLSLAFDRINQSHERSLTVPMSQMKGIDEFGCVLADVSVLPSVVSTLLDHTHPVAVRFGVASGAIDVGGSERTVAEMDGPAFHEASEMLGVLKQNDLYVGIDTGEPCDDIAAAALNLLVLHTLSLSSRQIETILEYESSATQSEAATDLGISQQAVSNALQAANYYQTEKILTQLREGFETIYGG